MLSRKILMHNFLEPFICVVDNFFQKILNFMRSILIIPKSKIDQRSSTLVNTYVCKYIYRCLERESSKFPGWGWVIKISLRFWGDILKQFRVILRSEVVVVFGQGWPRYCTVLVEPRQSIHNCQISDSSRQISILFCQGKRPFSDYIFSVDFFFPVLSSFDLWIMTTLIRRSSFGWFSYNLHRGHVRKSKKSPFSGKFNPIDVIEVKTISLINKMDK